MKVLVLTVTTGQGHNQVAKTLSEHLEKNEGVESCFLDTLEYINQGLKEIVSRGYLMTTKRLPKVYGKAYRLAEKREGENSRIVKITSSIMAKKLLKFIEEYGADVVVCTHVFSAILITYLKKKYELNIKTVGIVTDFTIHPYWEETEMDYYVTANECLTNQAVKKGIEKTKVKPLGIPIDPKFERRTEKALARHVLGFEEKRTVLVMSGSMGYGKVVRTIKKIDSSDLDFQIVSVCGSNERLKKQVDSLRMRHKLYNFGFSDQIDLFMDAADCIVTKPGGLTTSEALAKALPMIIANPIPGQEDRNVEFLLNNGAAFKMSSTFTVDEALFQLFSSEERIKIMNKMVELLGKPKALRDIVELILEMGGDKRDDA